MLTDAQLIARCKKGRLDAFGELVRRYENRLFRSLLHILQNAEDARDALQDAFLAAYQSLDQFEGRADFYTWLYRIGVNQALTSRRKRRKSFSLTTALEGKSFDPVDPSRTSEPSFALTCAEQSTTVWSALSRMSTNDRAILVMKDIEGMKYEQIAQLLGVPVGTIRSRLHRARLELRGLIEAGWPAKQARRGGPNSGTRS